MRISDWSSDVCSSDLPVTKLLDLVERGRLEAAGSEDLEPPEQLGVTEDIEVGVGEGVGAGLLHRMHAVMRELARLALPLLHQVGIDDDGHRERCAARSGSECGDRLAEADVIAKEQGLLQIGRASCRERVCQYV